MPVAKEVQVQALFIENIVTASHCLYSSCDSSDSSDSCDSSCASVRFKSKFQDLPSPVTSKIYTILNIVLVTGIAKFSDLIVASFLCPL